MNRREVIRRVLTTAALPSNASARTVSTPPDYLAACIVGRNGIPASCSEVPIPTKERSLLYALVAEIGRPLGVSPRIQYMGGECGVNAFASRPASVDTIFFGDQLARAAFDDSYWGDISLLGILAHECAHLVQYRSFIDARARHIELEADFIAGYCIGFRRRVEKFDFRSFVEAIEERTSGASHGKTAQRVRCINYGFQSGFLQETPNADEAFRLSRRIAASVAEGKIDEP